MFSFSFRLQWHPVCWRMPEPYHLILDRFPTECLLSVHCHPRRTESAVRLNGSRTKRKRKVVKYTIFSVQRVVLFWLKKRKRIKRMEEPPIADIVVGSDGVFLLYRFLFFLEGFPVILPGATRVYRIGFFLVSWFQWVFLCFLFVSDLYRVGNKKIKYKGWSLSKSDREQNQEPRPFHGVFLKVALSVDEKQVRNPPCPPPLPLLFSAFFPLSKVKGS